MKVINIDSSNDKCTIELTSKEIAFLSELQLEIIGGALNISEQEWRSVPMIMDRTEARSFLRTFREAHIAFKSQR